jgi:hypothetical protein
MKLNIVPVKMAVQWVKLGIQTFFKQPLAMAGLFFIFMAVMSVLSIVPVLGSALALLLLPGLTLGLMAATEITTQGKFPMPLVLFTAYRAGKDKARAMLTLGAIYAAGFLLVLGLSALADGGKFARMYLIGGAMTAEVLQAADFQTAMLVALALYLPLSLLFWHAPALVFWHSVPPVKALFFSLVACWRNFGTLTVYGLAWFGTFLAMGVLVATIVGFTGNAELVSAIMFPSALLMAAMFFTSIFFTFRDSFDFSTGDAP